MWRPHCHRWFRQRYEILLKRYFVYRWEKDSIPLLWKNFFRRRIRDVTWSSMPPLDWTKIRHVTSTILELLPLLLKVSRFHWEPISAQQQRVTSRDQLSIPSTTLKRIRLHRRIFFDREYTWRRVIPAVAARLDKGTSRDQVSTKRFSITERDSILLRRISSRGNIRRYPHHRCID